MKVLNVLNELRASGGEVMLREATPIFRYLDVEPCVLSTGCVVGDYAAEYTKEDVRVLHLPFARNLGFAISFFRLLRRERPAVVHVHAERANAVICLLARLSGARVVRTVHNVFMYTGRLRLVRTLERSALRALGVRSISIGVAVQRNERIRLRNPTTRIDNWIAGRFRPATPVERAAARSELGLLDSQYVITSVGNCSPVKNHSSILAALPAIARTLEREVVYLHAGTGQDEVDEKAQARTLKDSAKVRFLGTVQDVRPIHWASDLFCMPSLYEGVSIAALEALACGVPSVLSDVDGMHDVHADGLTVRFVPPTAEGLTQGIAEIDATDTEARKKEASLVATEVRKQRCVRRRSEELVKIYRGE